LALLDQREKASWPGGRGRGLLVTTQGLRAKIWWPSTGWPKTAAMQKKRKTKAEQQQQQGFFSKWSYDRFFPLSRKQINININLGPFHNQYYFSLHFPCVWLYSIV
jgi:hypothetical protein